MFFRVTCRLLRQRLTLGSGPIYTVFPYVLINYLHQAEEEPEEKTGEDIKKFFMR